MNFLQTIFSRFKKDKSRGSSYFYIVNLVNLYNTFLEEKIEFVISKINKLFKKELISKKFIIYIRYLFFCYSLYEIMCFFICIYILLMNILIYLFLKDNNKIGLIGEKILYRTLEKIEKNKVMIDYVKQKAFYSRKNKKHIPDATIIFRNFIIPIDSKNSKNIARSNHMIISYIKYSLNYNFINRMFLNITNEYEMASFLSKICTSMKSRDYYSIPSNKIDYILFIPSNIYCYSLRRKLNKEVKKLEKEKIYIACPGNLLQIILSILSL